VTTSQAEDERAWAKATLHLAEAGEMDLARTPAAAVHSAYYAMHHAARAVLLRQVPDNAPSRHGAVIGRFGQIAKNARPESATLLQAGRDINRMYEERTEADYDVGEATDEATARHCLETARTFMAVCAQHFGFSLP
jgi:uncharacterized protein (UPF0332 family)